MGEWKAKVAAATRLASGRLGTFIHPNVVVGKVPSTVHADWDVPVKVRDGTTLRVNVFRPAEPGTYPVIMSAHPYGKDHIPARSRSGHAANFQYRMFAQPNPVSLSEWTSWEAPDPAVWVPNGYVVVNADLRGGGTSEGTGDLLSDGEAQDYTTTSSNGRPRSPGPTAVSGSTGFPIFASANTRSRRSIHRIWRRSVRGKASAISTATSFGPAVRGKTVSASSGAREPARRPA